MPALRPNEDDNSNSMSQKGQHQDKSSSDEGCRSSPASVASSPAASPSTLQRQAWTTRGQLLLDFHHTISHAINSPEMANRCSQIAEDMSRSERDVARRPVAPADRDARSSMAEEYGAEAALIVENKARRDVATRNRALALGLFSFVTLRTGRGLSSWTRRAIANRRYRFEQVPAGSEKHLASTAASEAIASTQPSKLRWSLWLAFDAVVSTSLAVLSGAFLFAPRPAAYVTDMAKLPLVEGKSAYAEMVCPPLLREYRRVLEKYGGRWPVRGVSASDAEGDALTQEDVGLNVVRSFVENCTKRSKYERALLEERNAFNLAHDVRPMSTLSRLVSRLTERHIDNPATIGNEAMSGEVPKLGTVPIPSPGVPKNIPINLDQDVLALSVEDKGDEKENDVKAILSTIQQD